MVVALLGLIVLAIYQNFVRGLFVAVFLAGTLASIKDHTGIGVVFNRL